MCITFFDKLEALSSLMFVVGFAKGKLLKLIKFFFQMIILNRAL